jgi:hypothetical protein
MYKYNNSTKGCPIHISVVYFNIIYSRVRIFADTRFPSIYADAYMSSCVLYYVQYINVYVKMSLCHHEYGLGRVGTFSKHRILPPTNLTKWVINKVSR